MTFPYMRSAPWCLAPVPDTEKDFRAENNMMGGVRSVRYASDGPTPHSRESHILKLELRE